MNIALIGFRGTGKTTIAKVLAAKMNKRMISTDKEIEKKTKISIEKFVKKYSWDKFRDVESEVIEDICCLDECVFDTGGGVIMRNENIVNLKKSSLIILLTADIKTITARLKEKKRPPLTKNDYIHEIRDVLKEREPRYKKAADYTLDTSRLDSQEASDLIMHYVRMELQ